MHKAESLRGQDVLVACKLFSAMVGKVDWSFPSLSVELDVSVGEIYNSVGRCRRAQLLVQGDRVSRPHLRELLVSAVPRISTLPAERWVSGCRPRRGLPRWLA